MNKVLLHVTVWHRTTNYYLHYTSHGHIKLKVLNTKAVFESQTGLVVADEINGILEEFQINTKVGAATVEYGCGT